MAAREIADQERLPADYVEQILLRLRRAGLVESVRGARGGYYLARDPGQITMHDIMTASEHQTFELNCESHPIDAERCAPGTGCTIRPVWRLLQQRVDDLLRGVTLGDLMKESAEPPGMVSISAN